MPIDEITKWKVKVKKYNTNADKPIDARIDP